MKSNYKVILFLILSGLIIPTYGFEIHTPLKQGALIYGTLNPDETVLLYDHLIQANDTGHFVAALPTWADDTVTFTRTVQGKTDTLVFSVQKRAWVEEIVNGLPPKKVTPSPQDQHRIKQEALQLKKARESNNYYKIPTCFQRPVTDFKRISSQFGSKRILNGIKSAGHSGTDYAAPIGTPVVAPADGIVKLTHPDMFYSGKTVLIDHGFGIFSSYSHLHEISVHPDQPIRRGEKIGTVGTTGRSTGPHLHFVLSWHDIRVDPEQTINTFSCFQENKKLAN